MNNRKQPAFTLIELLVVIVVISMLLGMVFKMMQFAKRSSDKAKTVATLESVGQALSEYRAEYGHYPPTEKIYYMYENAEQQTPWLRTSLAQKEVTDSSLFFDYGLVSYLWPRTPKRTDNWPKLPETVNISSEHLLSQDDPRAADAKERWAPFLAKVDLPPPEPSTLSPINDGFAVGGIPAPFTNSALSIQDAWEHDLNYKSSPPYLTYEFWSEGVDGEPLHKKTWDN